MSFVIGSKLFDFRINTFLLLPTIWIQRVSQYYMLGQFFSRKSAYGQQQAIKKNTFTFYVNDKR